MFNTIKEFFKKIALNIFTTLFKSYNNFIIYLNKKHFKKYYPFDMIDVDTIVCIKNIKNFPNFKIGNTYDISGSWNDISTSFNRNNLFINIIDDDTEYALPYCYLVYFVDEKKYNIFLADDRQKKLDKLIK